MESIIGRGMESRAAAVDLEDTQPLEVPSPPSLEIMTAIAAVLASVTATLASIAIMLLLFLYG